MGDVCFFLFCAAIVAFLLLAAIAASRTPPCNDMGPHDWGTWECTAIGQKRRCKKCGYTDEIVQR